MRSALETSSGHIVEQFGFFEAEGVVVAFAQLELMLVHSFSFLTDGEHISQCEGYRSFGTEHRSVAGPLGVFQSTAVAAHLFELAGGNGAGEQAPAVQ